MIVGTHFFKNLCVCWRQGDKLPEQDVFENVYSTSGKIIFSKWNGKEFVPLVADSCMENEKEIKWKIEAG